MQGAGRYAQESLQSITATLDDISQLRATVLSVKSCTESNAKLYLEYYEYVEQLCYAFPSGSPAVALRSSPNE